MPDNNYSAIQDALRNFYLRSQQALERLCAPYGITLARAKLLIFIGKQGTTRSIDMVQSCGLAPRTITEAIDALEAEGLVERTPDPVDRRVKRIVLTPSGVAALDALGPARQLLSDRLFAALDAAELDQLTELLERLNTRLLDLEQEDDTAANVPAKR
jgi:DNA-binding MarR family transcriptional regulator